MGRFLGSGYVVRILCFRFQAWVSSLSFCGQGLGGELASFRSIASGLSLRSSDVFGLEFGVRV